MISHSYIVTQIVSLVTICVDSPCVKWYGHISDTCHMMMRVRPETDARRWCPSCAPGLPVCVACYLDARYLERLEDDRLIDLEGYAEIA